MGMKIAPDITRARRLLCFGRRDPLWFIGDQEYRSVGGGMRLCGSGPTWKIPLAGRFIDRMSGRKSTNAHWKALSNPVRWTGCREPASRKVWSAIRWSIRRIKRKYDEGQMSLFDFCSEELLRKPDHISECRRIFEEEYLAYEKNAGRLRQRASAGEYIGTWEKNVTAKSSDFVVDETGSPPGGDSRRRVCDDRRNDHRENG